MLIREIGLEDYDIYCRLSEEFYATGASITDVKPENFKETFDACIALENPFLRGYVVEIDGEVVGYFLLTYTWYNELLGMTVTLDEIYVSEKNRGQGIGATILRWVAKTHDDYKGIILEVKKGNEKAASLYIREGFEYMDYCQMVLKPKEIFHKK